jgi:hypothetical protein
MPTLTCNQVNDLKGLNDVLKSNSQLIICPFCKQTALTKSEQKWSIPSLACGVAFGPALWILFQALRKKDINCMNAKHYCSRCGVQVGDYSAC